MGGHARSDRSYVWEMDTYMYGRINHAADVSLGLEYQKYPGTRTMYVIHTYVIMHIYDDLFRR